VPICRKDEIEKRWADKREKQCSNDKRLIFNQNPQGNKPQHIKYKKKAPLQHSVERGHPKNRFKYIVL
jgi:hypothetical protein